GWHFYPSQRKSGIIHGDCHRRRLGSGLGETRGPRALWAQWTNLDGASECTRHNESFAAGCSSAEVGPSQALVKTARAVRLVGYCDSHYTSHCTGLTIVGELARRQLS